MRSGRSILASAALALIAGAAGAGPLDDEVATARAAALPFADFGRAEAEGWEPFGADEPLMGQHFFHADGPDYVSGGMPLEPTRPSNLMYTNVGGRMKLVALSYNVRIAPGEPMPEGFSGQADAWHVHDARAFLNAALQDRPILGWLACSWFQDNIVEKDGKTRLAMVHLWLIPNPDGAFASHNRALAYLDLGLPVAWAEGASAEAALGLALASTDGCANALDAQFWVANVGGDAQNALRSACEQLASYVRADLSQKDVANRRGEAAWTELQSQREAYLTTDQMTRLMAMTENGHGTHQH